MPRVAIEFDGITRGVAAGAAKTREEVRSVQGQVDSSNRAIRRELAMTETQSIRSGRGFATMEKEVGRASRGAIAGSGVFRGFGRSIAFASGAFLGGVGFIHVIKTALAGAGDLDNQLVRSVTIFRGHGRQIREWSKTTYQSLGLARTTALGMANAFGTMFSAMNVSPAVSSRFSQDMARVAAAISLARGEEDPGGAQQALAVALAGRGRALRQYGIILDQTTIKAEAMRLGLVKTAVDSRKVQIAQDALAIATAKAAAARAKYGENATQTRAAEDAITAAHIRLEQATGGATVAISKQATAIAAHSLIMQQGKRFLDRYGDSMNTDAGRMRRFHEGVKTLEEELGTGLMPTFARAMTVVNRWIASIAEGGSRHERFVRTIQSIKTNVGALAAILVVLLRMLNRVVQATGGWPVAFELILGGILAKKFLNVVGAISSVIKRMVALAATTVATSAVEVGGIETVTIASTGLVAVWAVALPAAFAAATILILANAKLISNAIAALYAQSETPQIHDPATSNVTKTGRVYVPGTGFATSGSRAGRRYLSSHPNARVYAKPPRGELGAAIAIAQRVRAENPGMTNAEQEKAVNIALAQEGFSASIRRQAIIQTRPKAQYGGHPASALPPSAGGTTTGAPAPGSTASNVANLAIAASQRPGARSRGFHLPGERQPYDCSAFVQAVFKNAGAPDPGSTTYQQVHAGVPVKASQIQPGDIVLWNVKGDSQPAPNHVGIYIGGGVCIHDHGQSGGVDRIPYNYYPIVAIRRIGVGDRSLQPATPTMPTDPSAGAGGLHVGTTARKGTDKPDPVELRKARSGVAFIEEHLGGVLSPTIAKRLRNEAREIEKALEGVTNEAGLRKVEARLRKLQSEYAKAMTLSAATKAVRQAAHTISAQIERLPEDMAARIRPQMAHVQSELANVTSERQLAKIRRDLKKVQDAVANAIDKLKTIVEQRRSAFSDAFGKVADKALEIFDAKTQELLDHARAVVPGFGFTAVAGEETPTERRMRQRQEAADEKARRDRIAAARQALYDAQTQGGDVVSAQKELQDALYDEETAGLQKRADAERKAADAAIENEQKRIQQQRDALREQLAGRISDVQTAYANGEITAQQAQNDLLGILKDPAFQTDFQNVGDLMGQAFSAGFTDAITDLTTAVNALIDAINAVSTATGKPANLPRAAAILGRHTPHFKRGGIVPGRYVGRADTVMAAVTPGEEVVDRTDVALLHRALTAGGGASFHGAKIYVLGTTEREVRAALAKLVSPELDREIRLPSPRA